MDFRKLMQADEELSAARSKESTPMKPSSGWQHDSSVGMDYVNERGKNRRLPVKKLSFMDIVQEQTTAKAVVVRAKSKSLQTIQIEERALEEIAAAYEAEVADGDEWITVELVSKVETQ